MQKGKKILSILIKSFVGLGSIAIIYWRLQNELSAEKIQFLLNEMLSASGLLCLLACLILVPVNWTLEAVKWKIITAPVQWISLKTAIKSVCSGVCVGNLAPGRATEFLAKIIYFKPDNRSGVTVLHFVGGLFQLSITILAGILALIFRIKEFEGQFSWITWALPVTASLMLLLLGLSIIKINSLINFFATRFSKNKHTERFNYHFSYAVVTKLIGYSALRYSAFFLQYYLLILMLSPASGTEVFAGIALYFFITTLLPMVSALEPAIRAAVALVVFRDSGLSETILALCSVLLWILNIILPSVVGYYFLVKQNFSFKLSKSKSES